ncbi:MAG: hypothetical protein QOE71_1191 [Pseudonocardiales bacterium]|nr:hypothetical protein [Pseudonocardiales bacterium]
MRVRLGVVQVWAWWRLFRPGWLAGWLLGGCWVGVRPEQVGDGCGEADLAGGCAESSPGEPAGVRGGATCSRVPRVMSRSGALASLLTRSLAVEALSSGRCGCPPRPVPPTAGAAHGGCRPRRVSSTARAAHGACRPRRVPPTAGVSHGGCLPRGAAQTRPVTRCAPQPEQSPTPTALTLGLRPHQPAGELSALVISAPWSSQCRGHLSAVAVTPPRCDTAARSHGSNAAPRPNHQQAATRAYPQPSRAADPGPTTRNP